MGVLRSTYTIHLRLVEKRVVDFLLVLIELFSLAVTAEALRANIEYKQSRSLFATAKRLTLVSECLPTLSLTVFTQRNFVAKFLQAKCDFTRKTAVLQFSAQFGGLGTTYDVHLWLIGKRVVDFLLVLIELFC